MILTKLSYRTQDWELIDLELDQVNLLVGKNGTGKSRTLDVLKFLVKVFDQKFDRLVSSKWDLTFTNSRNEVLTYRFEANNSNNEVTILSESLVSNDIVLIERNSSDGIARVYNVINKLVEEYNPPQNKLVLHTNRDVKKYPFIEELCVWAEESYGCLFANISAFSKTSHNVFFESNLGELEIPSMYESLSTDSKKLIVDEINRIGYQIDRITPVSSPAYLLIHEKGLDAPIGNFRLSQGMLRALYILIYIEYIFSTRKPTMILIDDFCEGLDYERATKLGKLIYDKCLNTNIQLVATSNDLFLMEVVDLKYWNVLRRKGMTVTAINNKNHPKVFQDFKFTGLSNFDFFASDYLNQELAS